MSLFRRPDRRQQQGALGDRPKPPSSDRTPIGPEREWVTSERTPARVVANVSPSSRIDQDDWDAIGAFLAQHSEDKTTSLVPSDLWAALAAVVDRLWALSTAQYVPVRPLADVLLELWESTQRVGPDLARPVETFLVATSRRQVVAGRELAELCACVEKRLSSI